MVGKYLNKAGAVVDCMLSLFLYFIKFAPLQL